MPRLTDYDPWARRRLTCPPDCPPRPIRVSPEGMTDDEAQMVVSVARKPPCQGDLLACEALPAVRRLAIAAILNLASRSLIASGSKAWP